jgi:hypothetical protein
MSQYARDLDADDLKVVRHAANSGCTTEQFARDMSISVDQLWKFLDSPNGVMLREQFEQNDRAAASQSNQ